MNSYAINLSLNLLLAVIWLLLNPEPTWQVFAMGFLIGFGLLALFRPILKSGEYVRRSVALVRFVLIFAKQVVLSNIIIAKAVFLQPKESISPNFITYDISELKPWEILVLSHCITLTPGTTSVDITDNFRTLIIHVFDVEDADDLRRRLDRTLKEPLLAFTR